MPKIVNHEERKEKIVEAAWQVIRREGLGGVTVRRVAQELGISLGSLRYYFDTQDELITFTMQLISQRVNQRIEKLPFNGEPRHDIELVIAEIAPLDEERKLESEVWLAFAGKAVSDPFIRGLSLEVHEQLYTAFRRMIDLLIACNITREGINAEQETQRLHALVDGLVVHHTTFPDRFAREELMGVVSYHLNTLLRNER